MVAASLAWISRSNRAEIPRSVDATSTPPAGVAHQIEFVDMAGDESHSGSPSIPSAAASPRRVKTPKAKPAPRLPRPRWRAARKEERFGSSESSRAAALAVGIGGPLQPRFEAERARELFQEGNQAFAEGDLHGAYDAYQEAWAIRRSFDVACNLGRTEAGKLGLDVAAAEHLDLPSARSRPAPATSFRNAEQRFKMLLDGVLEKIGRLRLVSSTRRRVFIDGASMGNGPLNDLYLAPGEHRVVVRAKGYRQRELVLNVRGSNQTVQVKLELRVGGG